MIQLKSLGRNQYDEREAIADYEVSFQSSRGREGTTVTVDLKMVTSATETVITGDFGECESGTPDEALEKLAFWFENFAKEIRERKVSATIPIFGR